MCVLLSRHRLVSFKPVAAEIARPLEADAIRYKRSALGGEHFFVTLRASLKGEKVRRMYGVL